MQVEYVAWMYQVNTGGVERIAHELANHRYQLLDQETTLAYAMPFWWRKQSPFADYSGYHLKALPLPVHPYINNGKYKGRYIEPFYLRLARLHYKASRKKPDLVHGLGSNGLAASLARIPMVATLVNVGGWWYEHLAISRAQKLICLAQGVADKLVAERHVKHDRIEVIHQGVNAARFSNADYTKAYDAYNLPRGRRYIVSLHNLQVKRRTEDLIEAMEILDKNGDLPEDMDLVISGRGAREDAIRQRIAESPLEHRVHLRVSFEGDHLPDLYALSHIFASAGSTYEGDTQIPLTTFESMTVGVPLVSANIGAISEVVAHGENAWLVEPSNAQALADGLRELLRDEALRKSIIQNAKETAPQYSWESIVKRQEAIYQAILS